MIVATHPLWYLGCFWHLAPPRSGLPGFPFVAKPPRLRLSRSLGRWYWPPMRSCPRSQKQDLRMDNATLWRRFSMDQSIVSTQPFLKAKASTIDFRVLSYSIPSSPGEACCVFVHKHALMNVHDYYNEANHTLATTIVKQKPSFINQHLAASWTRLNKQSAAITIHKTMNKIHQYSSFARNPICWISQYSSAEWKTLMALTSHNQLM